MLADLRYAWRTLRKNSGFAAVAILTLALGIGANTALFTVVNGVLLKPFPYPEPERLVTVWEQNLRVNLPLMFASPPNLHDWHQRSRVFEEMGGYATGTFFLSSDNASIRLRGLRMTPEMFAVLGVEPLLGRAFTAESARAAQNRQVVLSYGLWQQQFGGDTGIVGRTVMLNDQPYEVTGVMPAPFKFPPPIKLEGSEAPSNAEIWVPYGELASGQRGAHHLVVVARLKPGVTPKTAAAEINSIQAQLAAEFPDSNSHWTGTVIPLDAQVLGDVKLPIVVLMGAVAFVLLIACVNVANLLLARAADRRKEFAIRAALGAGAARLVRQLLAESFILAALGGALGLLLAVWGMDALLRLAPSNIPRLDDVSLDWRVAVFALAISIFTGVLFGLAPLAQGLDPHQNRQLSQSLRQGGRTSSGAGGGARLRSALVVAEVALSLVLLVGAGLMLETFRQLRGTDAGFQTGNAVSLRLTLPAGRYADRSVLASAFMELERRINALPQVERAGFVLELPLAGDRQGTSFEVEGDPPEGPETRRQIGFTFVTPEYFPAMGVRMVAGRNLRETDTASAPAVLVVNQAFVERFPEVSAPDGNVIGKRIFPGSRSQVPHEIVGVVSDVRFVDLREAAPPTVYMPVAQFAWSRSMSLVVRSRPQATDATGAALAAVREEIAAFDRNIPVYDIQTLDEVLAGAVATPRFSSLLLGAFSALALALAGIGIYGVVSYGVSRRTHEIGVRMALGAQPRDVLRLILREGAGLAVAGIAAGIVAALALTRALAGLLYGVSTTDAFTYVVVCATLLGITLVACWVPARRASRVDPMVALRYE